MQLPLLCINFVLFSDYKSLTTDQKPYDYVEPTEVDVKQVNNPRTPPDGFENTEGKE